MDGDSVLLHTLLLFPPLAACTSSVAFKIDSEAVITLVLLDWLAVSQHLTQGPSNIYGSAALVPLLCVSKYLHFLLRSRGRMGSV